MPHHHPAFPLEHAIRVCKVSHWSKDAAGGMFGMDAVISFLGHRSTCWKAGCWQWMDVLARARSRRQTEIGQLRLEIPEIFGGEDGDGDEGADEADDAKGREKYPLEPELDSAEGL